EHCLTAEEMWGDGGSAGERAAPAPLVLPEETCLTAEEMWGGGSSDGEQGAPELRGEPAGAVDGGPPSPAERLRRMLAGPSAPSVLRGLSPQEVEALAADCRLAAETLHWVVRLQQGQP
ncbi:unnamed protein product, partial [Prorocentrum cordatum]